MPEMKKIFSVRLWLSKAGAILRGVDAAVFGISFAQYHRKLREVVLSGGCESLLDVGCGERSPLHLFSSEIVRTTGVDAHGPSIETSRSLGVHSDYVQMNILGIGEQFAPRSYDCVVALDVIEHLSKSDGQRLLDAMESIARRRVVVFRPKAFLPP